MTNHDIHNNETTVPQMLSLSTTAGLLAVSNDSVYRLVRAGELFPTKVGRQLRFFPADVNRFLAEGVSQPMNYADLIGDRI